jgi:membrane protease YdiL (CAAX protease family)
MKPNQKILTVSPLVVIGTMYPVFQILASNFGTTLGWYLGLIFYWIIWGGLFSWIMIGPNEILRIIKPRRLNLRILFLILTPLILAGIFKFITGTTYEKPEIWIVLMLISTALGNGFFEELLWRGVYMVHFQANLFFRIIWASVWFGLWHYVPGTVSSNSNPAGLIIGSTLFGFYLAFLAKGTGTIWWGIVAHVLGGLVIVM